MGQAKLKKLAGVYPDTSRIDTLSHAAKAVATVAARRHQDHGRDCVRQAKLLAALLNDIGIPARVAIGHAAWRVGANLVDVVAHNPKAFDGPPSIHEPEGFEGHAWVEVAGLIVDSTANQWAHKLQRLGMVNGLKPTLAWPQDVLVIKQGRLKKSLESVLRARTFAAHYEALDGFKPALDHCELSAEDVAEVKAEFESTARRKDALPHLA
jgi:hypothetical protein